MKQCLRWIILLLEGTISIGALAFALAWGLCPFDSASLDAVPTSRVLLDCHGEPWFACIGTDEQRRLPVPLAQVSPWLIKAVLAVEDEDFYHHGGVDLSACARAAVQNGLPWKVKSGASTLSMQVARLADPNMGHGLTDKAKQCLRAWQMESVCDKAQILQAWMNLSPFGGNRRGVESASQVYFGRHARDLTLAEAALLAGLPQSPERYRPDRHCTTALKRRATVLRRMEEAGFISAIERTRAEAEPLRMAGGGGLNTDGATLRLAGAWPAPPGTRLSRAAAVGADKACFFFSGPGEPRSQGCRTTLDPQAQLALLEMCQAQANHLPPDLRLEAAVVEVATNRVIALAAVGEPQAQTFGLLGQRSPGSALKPFFYAAAFDAGWLAPTSRLPDRQEIIGGWQVRNFDRTQAGEVSAADALRQSLNGPAVRVVRGLGVDAARAQLAALGMPLPAGLAQAAGLTLATGGAEIRLLDLAAGWACVARQGRPAPLRWWMDGGAAPLALPAPTVLSPRSCARISLILAHGDGENREAAAWFCLKTGTSSGRRDAVAAGHNGRYAVVAWAGRVEGGASEALIGAQAAAPLVAAVFNHPLFRMESAPAWIAAECAGLAQAAPPLPARVRGAQMAGAPVMAEPAAGARLVARAGVARIHPRLGSGTAAAWFLDGRPLTAAELADGLPLKPGRYVFSAVGEDGNAAEACVRVVGE